MEKSTSKLVSFLLVLFIVAHYGEVSRFGRAEARGLLTSHLFDHCKTDADCQDLCGNKCMIPEYSICGCANNQCGCQSSLFPVDIPVAIQGKN
ncbi:unnamed protein product, partial [Linum tenue]